ncbi:MAG: hypothetical protein K6U12_09730 [Armatimonadetes bacterium]|nr:hypothetical protein [Armatimonadota bacterium]
MSTAPPPLCPLNALTLTDPQVWEDTGMPRDFEGPHTHTLKFEWYPQRGRRYWLRFDGASYEAVVELNGKPLGTHRGIWDGFTINITRALRRGKNYLTVHITKNGGARFPVPEVLSGFLPYVSSPFGGLWQPVRFFDTGEAWLSDLWIHGEADGTVHISGSVVSKRRVPLTLNIYPLKGRWDNPYRAELKARGAFAHTIMLPEPRAWSPETPNLYWCRVEVGENSHYVDLLFGLRTVEVQGSQIYLNGTPFYPRGLLHWGWYLDTHAPNPSREQAHKELLTLKEAGFNMLKACLWVPPDWYLAYCDLRGVAVWLELPLWLPQIPPERLEEVVAEYEAIVRQVRNHPCIVLWTLGCELSARFPAEGLRVLYERVKALTGSPLVRDNSGGGECYGGSLQEYADFADYHLYGDAHYARTTFRAFLEAPRPPQPWLQGEFADHDTMRDFISLRQKVAPQHLWWLSQDPQENPQGVRWFYETPYVEDRLKAQGLWDALPTLVENSRREMVAYHKIVLETMRSLRGTSGYVVTGLKDTPIATAGLLDERGEPKVPLEAYRDFNADTVVLIDWARRRVWQAGGDRPANPDPYNHFGGQTLYPRILLSHFGKPLPSQLKVCWELWLGETQVGHGEVLIPTPSGESPLFLCQLSVEIPPVSNLTHALFMVKVEGAGEVIARNRWRWGIYPRPQWETLGQVALYEPAFCFEEWELPTEVFRRCAQPPERESVLLATALPDWLDDWVAQGGRCLVLLPPLKSHTQAMPFWREATHRFLPHPVWERLGWMPQHLNERLFAFSTDYALLPQACLPSAEQYTPLWQRVDTRTGYCHAYLHEEAVGEGKALFTTLHFTGEHGDTPRTLRYHPAGQYWLYALLHYLIER